MGDQYDWIVTGDDQHDTGNNMFNGVDIDRWDGVTLDDVDDDDTATDDVMRVTEVSLRHVRRRDVDRHARG